MSLFDKNNLRHQEILREEIKRATKMLREYNEKEIWDVLSVDQREELLHAVDDDMGPDFAAEYAEEDWLNIPDVVTNRVDLHRFKKGDYVINLKINHKNHGKHTQDQNCVGSDTLLGLASWNKWT